MNWSNQEPINIGRQGSENIIHTLGGLTDISINSKTHLQSWEIFMDEIIRKIVTYTNQKISKKLADNTYTNEQLKKILK